MTSELGGTIYIFWTRAIGDQSGHPNCFPSSTVRYRPYAIRNRHVLGRQPGELLLHHVDSLEVGSDVVIAAALVGHHPEAACCIGVARCGSTEMDHGGQILLLLERRWGEPPMCQRTRDVSVEQGRGHLDRM